MPTLMDVLTGKQIHEPDVPVCPMHDVEMRLRGKIGRPSRFSDQKTSEYTMIYYCPDPECNETASRDIRRTQIPVPGASPERPIFARYKEKSKFR